MSGLWWLEPGWTDACCMSCGANIHATGGDPDWGYCYGCFTHQLNQQQQNEEVEALREENANLRKRLQDSEGAA